MPLLGESLHTKGKSSEEGSKRLESLSRPLINGTETSREAEDIGDRQLSRVSTRVQVQ